MQNEKVSEFEKIKRQLVKLKWQLTTNTIMLVVHVVSDTVRKDSAIGNKSIA